MRLIADTADESSYAENIDEHGIGSTVVLETQQTQHRAGLVWTHDDDTSAETGDYVWGIGKQFNTSGVGQNKLQIGYKGQTNDNKGGYDSTALGFGDYPFVKGAVYLRHKVEVDPHYLDKGFSAVDIEWK